MDVQVKYMSAGKIVSRCSDFFPQSKDMLVKLIGCMSLWVSHVIDTDLSRFTLPLTLWQPGQASAAQLGEWRMDNAVSMKSNNSLNIKYQMLLVKTDRWYINPPLSFYIFCKFTSIM